MPDRAVIFDLDGTLVETAPDLLHATNHVLERLGRRVLTIDEIRPFISHGARVMLTRGLAATGGLPDGYDVEPDYRCFIDYYAENIADGSAPYPGLTALLDRLKSEGIAMGVCTNKLEGLSIKLLEALGLHQYFGAVVGPDTLGVAKPDPRPFLETVRRLGLTSPRAIMVGDSETDVLTARAAGVPVMAVPFGYTPRPVAEFNPDALIEHYGHAWDALEGLWRRP